MNRVCLKNRLGRFRNIRPKAVRYDWTRFHGNWSNVNAKRRVSCHNKAAILRLSSVKGERNKQKKLLVSLLIYATLRLCSERFECRPRSHDGEFLSPSKNATPIPKNMRSISAPVDSFRRRK